MSEKYVVKSIVVKNTVIGLIGKTTEPDWNKSSEVMNQTNAQMEWTINFEPDFIGFRTRILSSETNTVICAKGVSNKFWQGAMEKMEEI